MFKILVILALMAIGNLYVAGMSCDSCGGECAPACGTRRFRTCCFNYLRRKRDPEPSEPEHHNLHESADHKLSYILETSPIHWFSHFDAEDNQGLRKK